MSKSDVSLLPTQVKNHWTGRLSKVSYGQEQVRLWWMGGGPKVSIDGWLESFSFDDLGDQAPVVTGSATLRQSLNRAPIPPIESGDLIVAQVRTKPTESWGELIRMRVDEPQRLASGQFTFQLANDANLLALGTDSWHYPADKTHPGGWFPWQIVEDVGKRCLINIVMPQVGKRIKKFKPMLTSSPIDVINVAMAHVRESERKTLTRRFEAGTLYLAERVYSPELMTLGPQLIEASLTETKKQGWATALTIRTAAEVVVGKDKKGKKKATNKGIVVELPARKLVAKSPYVKRYGYVHRVVYAHGATSATEAAQEGLAHMVRVLQPDRSLTITTPYIRGLRRGSYIRLALPTLGLTQIVYVSGISYAFSNGTFTMDVTCGFDDPVVTPPLDLVNSSTKGLKKTKKKNYVVNSSKMDAQTAKLYVAPNGAFGVATP